VFIPATMTAMLFACDMHAAAALGALFFQASGGALAADADERCEPQNIQERLGRLIAIGVTTVLVGMLPSMVLARLHHRDFVKIDAVDEQDQAASNPEWKKTLRLWQIQDRAIYLMCTLLLAFCFFYNLVFIANVTVEDGKAWFICVLTSMAQTVLGVPFLMTSFTFMGTLVSRLFARVRSESSHLCMADSIADTCDDNAENLDPKVNRTSAFQRAPLSKWNSNKQKRSIRKASLYNGNTFDREDTMDGFAASAVDSDWDLDIDVPTEAVDKAQCWSPALSLCGSGCGANIINCSMSVSSAAPQARDETGGSAVAAAMGRSSVAPPVLQDEPAVPSVWQSGHDLSSIFSCQLKTNI